MISFLKLVFLSVTILQLIYWPHVRCQLKDINIPVAINNDLSIGPDFCLQTHFDYVYNSYRDEILFGDNKWIWFYNKQIKKVNGIVNLADVEYQVLSVAYISTVPECSDKSECDNIKSAKDLVIMLYTNRDNEFNGLYQIKQLIDNKLVKANESSLPTGLQSDGNLYDTSKTFWPQELKEKKFDNKLDQQNIFIGYDPILYRLLVLINGKPNAKLCYKSLTAPNVWSDRWKCMIINGEWLYVGIFTTTHDLFILGVEYNSIRAFTYNKKEFINTNIDIRYYMNCTNISGHTKSSHTELGQTYSDHTETSHTKTSHTNSVHINSETNHTELGYIELSHTELGHINSDHTETGNNMSGNNMSGHNMSGHNMSGHNKSGYIESVHNKTGQTKTNDIESGYIKSSHTKSGYTKSGHPKAGHPKAGHPKSGHPKAGHPKAGHPKAIRKFSANEDQDSDAKSKSNDSTPLSFFNNKLMILVTIIIVILIVVLVMFLCIAFTIRRRRRQKQLSSSTSSSDKLFPNNSNNNSKLEKMATTTPSIRSPKGVKKEHIGKIGSNVSWNIKISDQKSKTSAANSPLTYTTAKVSNNVNKKIRKKHKNHKNR